MIKLLKKMIIKIHVNFVEHFNLHKIPLVTGNGDGNNYCKCKLEYIHSSQPHLQLRVLFPIFVSTLGIRVFMRRPLFGIILFTITFTSYHIILNFLNQSVFPYRTK